MADRINKSVVLFTIVFIICSMFSSSAQSKTLRALIVTGQSNHDWCLSTPIVKRLLEQTNLFSVDLAVSGGEGGDMTNFASDFASYDVVVLNYIGDLWSQQTQKAFVDYVSSGGGVVAFHSACNAFPHWKEFNRILGLGGWYGRDERWGPYIRWRGRVIRDYTPGEGGAHPGKNIIELTSRAPEHPVMKGLPRRWLHAKDGFNLKMRGPAENLTVLATAYADPEFDIGTGEHEPMIFTVDYGKGRVFHTFMGHAKNKPVDAMECVGFIVTFQRGAEWAATGKVTQKVPQDFPTATEVRRWKDYRPPQQTADRSGPTVQFDRTSSSVRERNGTAEIGVTLSGPQENAVSVSYKVTDGTAEEYYDLRESTVVFPPNTTNQKITINLTDDNRHEPATTIVMQLTRPNGAVLGGRTQHTLTIIDNDGVNWDGKRWYYSDTPTGLFVNGQAQLEWEPRDDDSIYVKLDEQRLSKTGDVAEFSYLWLSDGPTIDCNCMPFSGCIDDDVTCTAGTGDFRAGLFDSHGRGHVTDDAAEGKVFRGYRGYKFYLSPHVSSKVGRFRDHTGEVHISGGIYKRKDPDNDTMLLSKNSNYRRLRINGGFDLPLNILSPLTIRLERLSQKLLKIAITLNDITYTTIDDDPTDQPQKIDVFAITFPNARNYTRWVLAKP
ncbi:MAG: ThuA domain-containing protein [Planctomycetota bacterium]